MYIYVAHGAVWLPHRWVRSEGVVYNIFDVHLTYIPRYKTLVSLVRCASKLHMLSFGSQRWVKKSGDSILCKDHLWRLPRCSAFLPCGSQRVRVNLVQLSLSYLLGPDGVYKEVLNTHVIMLYALVHDTRPGRKVGHGIIMSPCRK